MRRFLAARLRAGTSLLIIATAIAPFAARAGWPLRTVDPLVEAPLVSPEKWDFRLALEYQWASAASFAPDLVRHIDAGYAESIVQQEGRVALAISPARHVTLIAQLPYSWRHYELTPLGATAGAPVVSEGGKILGPVLGARVWLLRSHDEEELNNGGLAVEGGLRFPDAETVLPLGPHSTLSYYTLAPIAGVVWSRQLPRWDLHASVTGVFPLQESRYFEGIHFLVNAVAGWKVGPLELRGGVFADAGTHDVIYAPAANFPDINHLADVVGTGGLKVALAPAVRLRLFSGLDLEARVDIPVWMALTTQNRWSPQVWASVSYALEHPRTVEPRKEEKSAPPAAPGPVRQTKGEIASSVGGATWDTNHVTGLKADLVRRPDGSWGGTLGKNVIDVTVYPDRIVGANCSLAISQEGKKLIIFGQVNADIVRFEIDDQQLLIRTPNHSITQPRSATNMFGDITFSGDAILENPPEPQFAFALVAAFD